ncbi:hypothetical protein [Streptomyces sp. NRRL F-4489]|uniref:hypothetical protein n=1 Tax=Streptomyces sp. NRRL F-4489 TaxID=1609095 RepID=UPI00131D54DE|nr:hypothetical protein [Streptomyces sp. NRRL F-4489]
MAGRSYQLTSSDGIGIGYGRLEPGSVVDVISVANGSVIFSFPAGRTSPPPRLIRYSQTFFKKHFSEYTPPPVVPPPDPQPDPDPPPVELPSPDEIAQEVQ